MTNVTDLNEWVFNKHHKVNEKHLEGKAFFNAIALECDFMEPVKLQPIKCPGGYFVSFYVSETKTAYRIGDDNAKIFKSLDEIVDYIKTYTLDSVKRHYIQVDLGD